MEDSSTGPKEYTQSDVEGRDFKSPNEAESLDDEVDAGSEHPEQENKPGRGSIQGAAENEPERIIY